MLIILLVLIVQSEALWLRTYTSLKAQDDNQFKFLKLDGAFYDCSTKKVLDGLSMGIVDYDGAMQACVSDPHCKYFSFNKDTSQVYFCDDEEYTNASQNMKWIMGVKPQELQRASFKITPNAQGVCDDVIMQTTVKNLDEAIKLAKEKNADSFTFNLNQGSAVGPGIPSKTTILCRGPKKILERDGFLLVQATHEANAPPTPPKTIEAPCGLNGSIQPDKSKEEEGILPGQIVQAKRIKGTEI